MFLFLELNQGVWVNQWNEKYDKVLKYFVSFGSVQFLICVM